MDKFDLCLKLQGEKHLCPHCQQQLSFCNAPPFHVGDGLGWGSEYLFICLNNSCPLYAGSWEKFEEQYGQPASCRYVLLPGEKSGNAMMVGGADAFTDSLVDIEKLKSQNTRYCKEKEALEKLDACESGKDIGPALTLVLDEAAGPEGRKRACGVLEKISDTACIEPIRNHTFRKTEIAQMANMMISAILKANFQKECPACTELIKVRAKVCMHCGKEV